MSSISRRIRGTITNAVLWGIGWSVLGFAAIMVLRMAGVPNTPTTLLGTVVNGLKIGVGGAIAGTAFSAYIAFAYRNRSIRDISWLKFGLGGAIITAVSITGFVQGASLLGGGGLIEWEYMASTLAMFSTFGFVAAAGSMKLAQLATSESANTDQPGRVANESGSPHLDLHHGYDRDPGTRLPLKKDAEGVVRR